MIEGRLKLDQWDDKTTGAKRSKLRVVCESFEFLDSGNRGPEGSPAPAAPRAARPTAAPNAPAADPVEGDGPPESDDVPF